MRTYAVSRCSQPDSYGWPICQFYVGGVQQSETRQCGFVESHGALRSAARTRESLTHKLASRST